MRWGDYPGLPGRQCDHKGLFKREAGSSESDRDLKMLMLLALKMAEEGDVGQGRLAASRSCKKDGNR